MEQGAYRQAGQGSDNRTAALQICAMAAAVGLGVGSCLYMGKPDYVLKIKGQKDKGLNYTPMVMTSVIAAVLAGFLMYMAREYFSSYGGMGGGIAGVPV